ncbi:hypothetical protein [Streptomyces sp. UNOB3_S3]|uniref:phage tail tube protein n=1 Tax=Streptomyces sp. UNOB3_S3 TaxID=2871682 RepID=UPI001E5CE12D|nr:hypothetical protein [Streptomyces sp. UNOB3_S3]MCC3773487.1 hypothetical protein [Streptomyces sp. UNOB3_S3]
MAEKIEPVMNPSQGYVYVAEVGTPMPALPILPKDPNATMPQVGGVKSTAWRDVGNTSLENGIEMSVDGDDAETLGSWQNPNLKQTNPKKTYALTVSLEDFTVETYKLYYGAGDEAVITDPVTSKPVGFNIPLNPTATEKALLIVGTDGDNAVAWHYPKVAIIGGDSITLDPAALSEVPVKATILGYGGSTGTVTERYAL